MITLNIIFIDLTLHLTNYLDSLLTIFNHLISIQFSNGEYNEPKLLKFNYANHLISIQFIKDDKIINHYNSVLLNKIYRNLSN